ncbi:hypothetical protein JTB14_026908 [Gonioctena quinquepunctata]|nr:hypothetical protein JTB14_026908 [Gonioctena quinquepunctata]
MGGERLVKGVMRKLKSLSKGSTWFSKRFESSMKSALDSAHEILDHIPSNHKNTDGLIAKMMKENIEKKDMNRIIVV